ncbi:unnamed protein product, partial [Choristocarpus tenellus]
EKSRPDEWCQPTDRIGPGTVLLADPAPFVDGNPK